MSDEKAEIRALIERWAKAVHAGDMDGVLADHAEDIVMFDVPPPNEVRGKAAYGDTWPPFFEWQPLALTQAPQPGSSKRIVVHVHCHACFTPRCDPRPSALIRTVPVTISP